MCVVWVHSGGRGPLSRTFRYFLLRNYNQTLFPYPQNTVLHLTKKATDEIMASCRMKCPKTIPKLVFKSKISKQTYLICIQSFGETSVFRACLGRGMSSHSMVLTWVLSQGSSPWLWSPRTVTLENDSNAAYRHQCQVAWRGIKRLPGFGNVVCSSPLLLPILAHFFTFCFLIFYLKFGCFLTGSLAGSCQWSGQSEETEIPVSVKWPPTTGAELCKRSPVKAIRSFASTLIYVSSRPRVNVR